MPSLKVTDVQGANNIEADIIALSRHCRKNAYMLTWLNSFSQLLAPSVIVGIKGIGEKIPSWKKYIRFPARYVFLSY